MIVLLLVLSQFPSTSDTTWMEPAAFHLELGQRRAIVESEFDRRGWKLDEDGDSALIHDYADGKAVTMEFRDDRLASVRFELISFRPQLTKNWTDVRDHLRSAFGEPMVQTDFLLLTGADGMQVHAVLEDDLDSDLGRQGAGRIIVRYFVPVDTAPSFEAKR